MKGEQLDLELKRVHSKARRVCGIRQVVQLKAFATKLEGV